MSRRFRLILCLACAAAVALAFLAYGNEVRAQEQSVRDEALARYGGEVAGLVVTTRPLAADATVQRSDVEVRDWLVDLAPQGAITSLDDVVGRSLATPVAAGAPLCDINFSTERESVEVPSGYVGLSVPMTDKIGLTRDTELGSAVFAYRTHDGTTSLIASNLVVLSMPQQSTNGPSLTGACTLAVLPDDVAEVLSASSAGELRLVVPAEDVGSVSGGDKAGDVSTHVAPKEGDGHT